MQKLKQNIVKKEEINDTESLESLTESEKYPNVLFLGTASSSPSPTRNISSTLLNLSQTRSILLDCSESTMSQLNKYYADDIDFNNILCKIKAIFISHNHLDHYFGLFVLIKRRKEAFLRLNLPYEKLILMYPRTLSNEFRSISNNLFFKSYDEFLSLVNFFKNDYMCEVDLQEIKSKLGLSSLQTILVDHIPHSYACIIEVDNPQKYK